MKSLIEDELLGYIKSSVLPLTKQEAAHTTPKERSKYLSAVARAIANVDNAQWAKISNPAQEWVENCVCEINAQTSQYLTDFPDLEPDEVAPVPEEVTEKKDKPKPSYATRGPRTTKPGTSAFFRELILDNQALPKEDLVSMAEKAGYPVKNGTASTTFYETHATLKMLQEKGMLK